MLRFLVTATWEWRLDAGFGDAFLLPNDCADDDLKNGGGVAAEFPASTVSITRSRRSREYAAGIRPS